jgi:hypothetical protein
MVSKMWIYLHLVKKSILLRQGILMPDSGTSLAGPMVSGTAALIWSYYPKLTAQEVKQIILDSGTVMILRFWFPAEKVRK